MTAGSSKNLRRWLTVGLGGCVIAWSALIGIAVFMAGEGRALDPIWRFLSVPMGVVTVLLGAWRIAFWQRDQLQIHAFGRMLDADRGEGLDPERGEHRNHLRGVARPGS